MPTIGNTADSMGLFAKKSRRIVVHGHIGRGNVGDEAMLIVVVRLLRERFPHHELCLAYGDDTQPQTIAEDTATYFPRSFSAILKQLIGSEVFVIAGGTHLTCFGQDRRGKLLGILRQTLLLLAARFLGNKVMMLSVGIGPLETRLSRGLVWAALKTVHFMSVRDDASYELAPCLRYTRTLRRCPDAAFFVPLPDKAAGEKKRLGISVLPYFTSHMSDPEGDDQLVAAMVEAIQTWYSQHATGEVYLLPLCTQDGAHSDTGILDRIKAAMDVDAPVYRCEILGNPTAFLTQLTTMTHCIVMRYHAMLFAHAMGLPTVTIAYHAKNIVLADELKLPDDTVVPIENVCNGQLNDVVKLLCSDPDHFVAPGQFSLGQKDTILPEDIHRALGIGS